MCSRYLVTTIAIFSGTCDLVLVAAAIVLGFAVLANALRHLFAWGTADEEDRMTWAIGQPCPGEPWYEFTIFISDDIILAGEPGVWPFVACIALFLGLTSSPCRSIIMAHFGRNQV